MCASVLRAMGNTHICNLSICIYKCKSDGVSCAFVVAAQPWYSPRGGGNTTPLFVSSLKLDFSFGQGGISTIGLDALCVVLKISSTKYHT